MRTTLRTERMTVMTIPVVLESDGEQHPPEQQPVLSSESSDPGHS